jgi:two-component system, OmpR family, response regulator MprA
MCAPFGWCPVTQDSLSPLVVNSHRALDAILDALPAAYRGDPQSLRARAALEHAKEGSPVLLLLLPREEQRMTAPAVAEAVRFGDLVLPGGEREVFRGARKIGLTATELRLLELLLRHPGQILPRGLIFEHVWGWDVAATSNLLNVYIGYLRRKTEADGEPRLIHTVRGIGYVLRR